MELDCLLQYLDSVPGLKILALVVGLVWLLRTGLCLLCTVLGGLKAHVLRLGSVDLKRIDWAVVTGASDGIGRGYALELAKNGVNVVLVSRSRDKLDSVEQEIREQYSVDVKIVVVDFSRTDIYDYIQSQLSGIDVGLLVNNVGVSYDYPDYFLNVSDERLWQLVNVNMASMVMMTKMILADMVQRKKGIIVNVSSAAAFHPTPLLTVYTATKVFVDYFSAALQYEYSSKGIIIQTVFPYFVATKMARIKRSSFFAPDPRKYARDALATIGIQSRTTGTLSHALQGWILSMMPQWLQMPLTYRVLSGARRRAVAAKQKKK